MEPLLHLDYVVDRALLLRDVEKYRNFFIPHRRSREGNFQNVPYRSDYLDEIIRDIGIPNVGHTSFYRLLPNTILPTHVDWGGTLCSVNFVLSDNPSPITIRGRDYLYMNALLDTTAPHSVVNNSSERLLLKISSTAPYKEVADTIRYRSPVN
jgi:hypothetical protein